MSVIAQELRAATDGHRVDSDLLAEAQASFEAYGFAKLSFAVPADLIRSVAEDVHRLVAMFGVRRDLRMPETGNTPRRMRNVRQAEIARHGQVIPTVYTFKPLRDLVAAVAGEPVHTCPYEPEQYVVTMLERDGDTHGWHWDDYRYALVWIVDTPPSEQGGFVQCVPGTVWDKTRPSINKALLSGPTYSFAVAPGDVYLIRADTTMHRVYPITGGTRTIVNLAFASAEDIARNVSHETMDGLWAEIAPDYPDQEAS